jgi:hypothetical protein
LGRETLAEAATLDAAIERGARMVYDSVKIDGVGIETFEVGCGATVLVFSRHLVYPAVPNAGRIAFACLPSIL